MQLKTTAQMVEAAARGDQLTWTRLVERYSSMLWAIARAHRLSGVDAADVVQTSWLRLIEHLATIRNPEGVGAWLATTTRRECVRVLRQSASCQPSDTIETLVDARGRDVDTRLLGDDREADVLTAFARLGARDQALLRMLTADPAPSYEEIGAALGMPIGSIGPTRGRALARLRRELAALSAPACSAS